MVSDRWNPLAGVTIRPKSAKALSPNPFALSPVDGPYASQLSPQVRQSSLSQPVRPDRVLSLSKGPVEEPYADRLSPQVRQSSLRNPFALTVS